jgi:hypothetical protein
VGDDDCFGYERLGGVIAGIGGGPERTTYVMLSWDIPAANRLQATIEKLRRGFRPCLISVYLQTVISCNDDYVEFIFDDPQVGIAFANQRTKLRAGDFNCRRGLPCCLFGRGDSSSL